MPLSRVNGESDKAAKEKRIACVECRQQKVKCNVSEKSPGPCSRCEQRKLRCSVEPNFKRTYKRARLQQVEKEIKELKRSLSSSLQEQELVASALTDLNRPPQAIQDSDKIRSPTFSPPTQTIEIQNQAILSDKEAREKGIDPLTIPCSPKTIESVTVDTKQIQQLFLTYRRDYHDLFPLVDLSRRPSEIYDACPLLFWVIVYTAARRLFDPQLFTSLSQPLQRAINNCSPSHPDENKLPSVFVVQALLLYATWQPPVSVVTMSAAWTTSGVAMYTALKIGLHCPGRAQDFDRVRINPRFPEIKESVRTWICCNIISQSIASAYGFPAFAMYDWTIINACRTQSSLEVPKRICFLMEINRMSDRISKTLNSDYRSLTGIASQEEARLLIKVFSTELDHFEVGFGELDLYEKLLLDLVRLQLKTYYFFGETLNDEPFREGLIQCYFAAICVLKDALDLDAQILLYIPIYVFMGITMAMCVLLKLISCDALAPAVDIKYVQSLFLSISESLHKIPILDNEIQHRMLRGIIRLWNARNVPGILVPTLKVKTRMSASVLFDILWTYRIHFRFRNKEKPLNGTSRRQELFKPGEEEAINYTESENDNNNVQNHQREITRPITANSFHNNSSNSDKVNIEENINFPGARNFTDPYRIDLPVSSHDGQELQQSSTTTAATTASMNQADILTFGQQNGLNGFIGPLSEDPLWADITAGFDDFLSDGTNSFWT